MMFIYRYSVFRVPFAVSWASTPSIGCMSKAQASQLRHRAQLSAQTNLLSETCAASEARRQQEQAWDEGMAERMRPTKGQSINDFLK